MNSRERVLAAFDHTEADRVPIDLGTTDTTMAFEVYQGVARLLGLNPQPIGEHPAANIVPDEAVLNQLGADVRRVNVPAKPGCQKPAQVVEENLEDGSVRWTYADGRVYLRPSGTWDQQLLKPVICSDLTMEGIDKLYPAQVSREDWADAEAAHAAVTKCHDRGLAVQCHDHIRPVTVTSNGALDFTGWVMEFGANPELVCRLMDRYLAHCFARSESFYRAVGGCADVVFALGDDVATQTGLWMSPSDYRRYIKPRHAEIVRFVKARTPARVMHHCCGSCAEIIPDLIEIGVDVLHPVQTSAHGMDPCFLKREFGADLTFWGGIDVVEVLPRGSVREVEDAVKRHLDALAPGGGYVFAPSHVISRGTPPENVVAMYKTAMDYGRYA